MRKFLLLLVFTLGSVVATFAQMKISGKVVDAEDGQPIIGATVMVDNTTIGVATLLDGTYVLPIPASAGENPVVRFSYVGYEDQVVPVGEQQVINVKLMKSADVIEEVVVTGFKNAKKEDIIRSIPLNRLLTETDAPYMTPHPFRGQTNYPKYIKYTYMKMADALGITSEELEKIIRQNTLTVFKRIKL